MPIRGPTASSSPNKVAECADAQSHRHQDNATAQVLVLLRFGFLPGLVEGLQDFHGEFLPLLDCSLDRGLQIPVLAIAVELNDRHDAEYRQEHRYGNNDVLQRIPKLSIAHENLPCGFAFTY